LFLGARKNPVYYVAGIVFLITRQYFDMLDGSVARVCGMKSRFGNIYDHVADAVYVLGLLALFVYLTPPPARVVAMVISGLGYAAFLVDIVNIIREKDVLNETINDNLMLINVFVYMLIVGFIEASRNLQN